MRQHNATEVLGYSFQNIYIKNGNADPLDAKFAFFGFSQRDSLGSESLTSVSECSPFGFRMFEVATLWLPMFDVWFPNARGCGALVSDVRRLVFQILSFGC